ncbi:MAG: broad-spectrum mercury transporter MerE [Acidiferrobacterales bacterium]
MTTPDTEESSRHRRGYVYALLAVVTCPCHLPIFALLLSGSAMGVFLSDHFGTALIIFSLLFVFSLAAAVRVLRGKPAHEN